MSYENQKLTEHLDNHKIWLLECEYCQAERENRAGRKMEELIAEM